MKHLTVSIPDSFYKTFVEFFRNVPNVKIEESLGLVIPEWHKAETLKRIKSSTPEDFIPWSKAKKQLKFKSK